MWIQGKFSIRHFNLSMFSLVNGRLPAIRASVIAAFTRSDALVLLSRNVNTIWTLLLLQRFVGFVLLVHSNLSSRAFSQLGNYFSRAVPVMMILTSFSENQRTNILIYRSGMAPKSAFWFGSSTYRLHRYRCHIGTGISTQPYSAETKDDCDKDRDKVPDCAIHDRHLRNLTDHKTLPNTQLHWTDEVEVHFNAWKQAITTAPTLGLPDYGKVFHLHAQETEVVAIGVLLQQHGPTYRPVAYLSKKLDNVASGMPACCGCSCSDCTDGGENSYVTPTYTVHVTPSRSYPT